MLCDLFKVAKRVLGLEYRQSDCDCGGPDLVPALYPFLSPKYVSRM